MFVTATDEIKTRKIFARKFREQLAKLKTAAAYRVSNDPKKGSKKPIVGECVKTPEPDSVHIFNNDMMKALSHAVEDLAADAHEGHLILTFRNIESFTSRRKRYVRLARRVDSLRVWGEGNPPDDCPNIDFVPTFHPTLNRYWTVLYTSASTHAILAARQITDVEDYRHNYFMGFFSFNPFLAESARRSFALTTCGLEGVIDRWEKEHHMPTFHPEDTPPIPKSKPKLKPKAKNSKAPKRPRTQAAAKA